jgi:hypothetical protein
MLCFCIIFHPWLRMNNYSGYKHFSQINIWVCIIFVDVGIFLKTYKTRIITLALIFCHAFFITSGLFCDFALLNRIIFMETYIHVIHSTLCCGNILSWGVSNMWAMSSWYLPEWVWTVAVFCLPNHRWSARCHHCSRCQKCKWL